MEPQNKWKQGICDDCRTVKLIKQHYLVGVDGTRSVHWCSECYDNWMNWMKTNKGGLLEPLEKLIKENKLPWFVRIRLFFKDIFDALMKGDK